MNADMLIAELENNLLKNYIETGIVDKPSLYDMVESALRPFANFISVTTEKIVYVEERTAYVPDFHSLKLAYKCEPFSYEEQCGEKVIDTKFYRKLTNRKHQWSSCDPCCVEESETFVTEEIIVDDCPVKLYYEPQWLSLSPRMNRENCDSNCANLSRNDKNEIYIHNNTLHANFNKGYVFLVYKALERDIALMN